MSSKCSPFEFEKQFQAYLSAYALADHWQRSDAMKSFMLSVARLHYFSVAKMEITTKNHPMIEVRGQFSLAKRLPELVQIDMSNVWNEACSKASHAFHTYEKTSLGFDAFFMAVCDNTVVTYMIEVAGSG